MCEESKRLKQYVIDAVVGGNLDRLGPSLASLSKVDPGEYLALTRQLIDTGLPKQTTTLVFGYQPEFFHADGIVYGVAFADAPMPAMFTRNAHPSGTGLALADVQRAVAETRRDYEATILKKVAELKERLSELDFLLGGHSAVDQSIASLARTDLAKGHALLVAAVTTNK
ncbi:hypothetical protein [Pseudomonas mosselii]|uniref:hypothetical protein n=1 Tax=Pseudomonas mosselii TaxID=78327 RepID=UPI001E56CEC0|nr:hypothetical protein [Pseudomonas mosselii]MCL8303235.1 hypothetical protein [Pseudomonas mosselii]MCL8342943.1 hypothetical protein [Pseudomonas mosselii]WJR27791.1 hypothetical protein LU678_026110 [Pseudomonas mosselii]WJR30079.1 hypothetical protein LU678_008540 [Pseudomonas mosselii]